MYSPEPLVSLPHSVSDQSVYTILEQLGSTSLDKDPAEIVPKNPIELQRFTKFISYNNSLEFDDGEYINENMNYDFSNNLSSLNHENQLTVQISWDREVQGRTLHTEDCASTSCSQSPDESKFCRMSQGGVCNAQAVE